MGEIDIVAIKDNILRFIEVKYRKSAEYGEPVWAITKKKQNKIYCVAQFFMQKNNLSEETACSFDVISILGNEIHYYFNSYGAM